MRPRAELCADAGKAYDEARQTVIDAWCFPRESHNGFDSVMRFQFHGMIQTREGNNLKKPGVFSVGCLGKIDTHTKTADGRYLINLKGLVRFRVLDEAETNLPYRKFRVTCDEFLDDLEKIKFDDKIDVLQLIDKARKLFKIHHLSTDWKIVEKVEPDQLINSLSMMHSCMTQRF